MCNLYSVTTTQEAMRRLTRAIRDHTGNQPAFREVYPGQMAPVVRRGADGVRELALGRWGFVLPQEGRAPKDVTNARADNVAMSSFWRASFHERRCLVPATLFCEWTDRPDPATGKKRKVWFGLKGKSGDDALFSFAGLWRSWSGPYRGETVSWNVYAFVTTMPNGIVAPVHAKAMPVMLTADQYDQWVDGTAKDAMALLRPRPDADIDILPGPGLAT